jgi:hypothetical protein
MPISKIMPISAMPLKYDEWQAASAMRTAVAGCHLSQDGETPRARRRASTVSAASTRPSVMPPRVASTKAG